MSYEQSYIYRGEVTRTFDCEREETMQCVEEALERVETMIEDLHTQMMYSVAVPAFRGGKNG